MFGVNFKVVYTNSFVPNCTKGTLPFGITYAPNSYPFPFFQTGLRYTKQTKNLILGVFACSTAGIYDCTISLCQ
jgi:hypothetical protein